MKLRVLLAWLEPRVMVNLAVSDIGFLVLKLLLAVKLEPEAAMSIGAPTVLLPFRIVSVAVGCCEPAFWAA